MALLEALESKVADAYRKERSRSSGYAIGDNTFPIALLAEWDKARRKLNPNAKMSYAEKLLQAELESE